MESILVRALDNCAPLVTLDKVRDKDPWISSDLLTAIRGMCLRVNQISSLRIIIFGI